MGRPGTLLWVDVQDPGPDEIEMLAQEFGFSALSLEDVVKQRQRPKVDEYPGYYFLVLYAALAFTPGKELRTAEVDIFVGQNFVVSAHPGEVPAIQEAIRRWENTDLHVRDRVGFLTHIVVDSVIDAFFPVVDGIDQWLDDLEVGMFRKGRNASSEDLLALKRSLFTLRKVVYPLREAFNTFPRREHALFDLETHPYFQDVYDHILRLLDTVEIQRDMVTDALDAHLAFISNELNETMKTLTVVGICVAIAGAVFGAWGMNVRGVPFAFVRVGENYMGFWIVCLITLALIGLGLVWARKRGVY